ncbi:MAG: TonB-dependent receptor [Myxococcales bacterium]|nr:TonB-dependent receptor [Myxococcales bacterium]
MFRKAPRVLRLGLTALSLVGLFGVSAVAYADDVADEADFQFRLAAKRYEVGDFNGALEHFLASNRLVPNKNVLFNIARTYEQLKQPADAYRYYQRALDGEPDPAIRTRIGDAIARIRPLVAVVRVESTPPGATLFIDRKDLGARGQTPMVLALPAGRYTFLGERAAHEPGKVEGVELKLGTDTTVRIPLAPIFGTLRVEGDPTGAEVRLAPEDAKPLCVIPCTERLPMGRRTLYVTKNGFQGVEVAAEIAANATTVVRPRLAAVFGTLLVSADVREALVTVDGNASGFTPAVLSITEGEHEVRVEKGGYRAVVRKVRVRKQTQAKVEAELLELDEVAAASRSLESVEDAPASVTIITGAELRAMGYPTISEAVRGVRGMYLSDDRNYEAVGVRGFSRPGDYGNRILVTIDGQSTNDNYAGSSLVGFHARVDLDDIDRIEVVRGPGSVLYGTGAFFGVINLVTRSRQVRTHGEVAGGTALDGVGRARATGVLRLGEDGGVWTSLAIARSGGRDFYFPEYRNDPRATDPELGADGLPSDGNVRNADGFSAGSIGGRAWWRFITVQWMLSHRTKSIPTGAYESVLGDPRSKVRDTRGLVELRVEPNLGKRVESLSRVHLNLYNYYGTYGSDPRPSLETEVFYGKWIGGEQRLVLKPADSLRITVGAELIGHLQARQFAADASQVYTNRNDPYMNAAGYLVGDITPVKAVKISAGARVDYYSNVAFDPLGATNPRLALIFDTWKGGKIKLLGGKAFRSPSVYELFSNGSDRAAAADLKPEQVTSGEVEVSQRISPTLVALLAGYTNYVSGLIELKEISAGKLRYENSDSPVLVAGGEAELRREWRQGFMASATVSVQKARYLDAPTLRQVPNSPVVLGSVKGAAPIVGRSLMAMMRVSVEGPRFDSDNEVTDPPQGSSRAGIVGDLVFSGEIERLNARYAVGAYNLADSRYESIPSREFRQRTILQNGRSFLANVSVSF